MMLESDSQNSMRIETSELLMPLNTGEHLVIFFFYVFKMGA